MGHRLSRIYTRTGDRGTTGLGNGSRVGKDDPRVEAYGAVDELNSTIGVVLSHTQDPGLRECLLEIQHDLFDLGGELCIPGHTLMTDAETQRLEHTLDLLNSELPALSEFILPGGSASAAACHVARAVCRRAERRLVTLSHQHPVNEAALCYLNRLSDLLFVIARVLARSDGGQEILWQRNRPS